MFWGRGACVKEASLFLFAEGSRLPGCAARESPQVQSGAGRCLARTPATVLAAGACPTDLPVISSLTTGTQARKATASLSPGCAPLSPSCLNCSQATLATVRRGGGGVGDLAYLFHI